LATRGKTGGRFGRTLAASLAIACFGSLVGAGTASAGTLPSGFQENTVISGLTQPTAIRFAPDGRVFVAEKSGIIKTFDGLSDTTPTVFADLRREVYNGWDRGLLGMALDPNFLTYPWVYVSYTHDAEIGGTAPKWGISPYTFEGCPTPPGFNSDGCVVSGRLSRLVSSGQTMSRQDVMIEDWCQQYPSHSVGQVEFDAQKALWVSGGEGASFSFVDYGQEGDPPNPCGDPPAGVGGTETPPTAEGGSLRSQDLETRSSPGDPTTLDGTLARVDINTGQGLAGNPLSGSSDQNERRIMAYGLRNPYRFAIAKDGNVYIGNVGSGQYEAIDRMPPTFPRQLFNFGWPCYEGPARYQGFDAVNLNICESLYSRSGAVTPPLFSYHHSAQVVPGESCTTGSSSLSGLEIYYASNFPASYDKALFFADYSRNCIWVMRAGANGVPDPSTVSTFDAGAAGPVDLEVGPDGALYYADFGGGSIGAGTIRRIQYTPGNQPPVAVADANPRSGSAPLTVNFDGSGSSDPEGGALTYAWDLDADGQYDDSTAVKPTYTYNSNGTYVARLRVTDNQGASATAAVTITVGNTPPTPTITTPTSSTHWSVGQQISFSGSATDQQQGTLPGSALDWDLIIHHCPSNCHTHSVTSFPDRASGSFTAPDHEYPSYLELRLTATDAGGLQGTTSVNLDPNTRTITLQSRKWNVDLVLNATGKRAPFTSTVIQGSRNTISAPSPQFIDRWRYDFTNWSDGGAQTHNVVVNSNSTYTATYRRSR
jgi:glucose/arabinose dehydrogenase